MTTAPTRWTRIGGVALVTAAVLLPAASASANGDDIIKRGGCSGSSDWKLKAGPEGDHIEVEGEVDSNKVGQTWRWRIFHNGDLSAKGTKDTSGPSGSFDVRRVLVDVSGDDRIVFKARNLGNDEVCRGALTY